ncbi:MAG: glutathione S-transferase N-terminal domain-containing protein [Polyangiaceae bacterium]
MPELIHLPFSPWSEKARWALDARGVDYQRRVYQPLSGELELRRRLSRWRGKVSVPLLLDGDRVLGDSFEIARWADAHGSGPRLFPAGEEQRIADWDALSERGMSAGRVGSLQRMLRDDEALAELVPPALRGLPGGVTQPLAAIGVRRTLRKYAGSDTDVVAARGVLASTLEQLRADLAASTGARSPAGASTGARSPAEASTSTGEPRTLLPEFSYADIVMAQVVFCIAPPQDKMRIGAASRRAFQEPGLAARFSDLVAWRDALYRVHRPEPGGTNGN